MPVRSELRGKTSRRYRANARRRGWTEVRVWVPEGTEDTVKALARKLRRTKS